MAALVYPAGLPCPQTSTVTPAERRALSSADRPREARNLQRDRLEYERITWPPMSSSDCDTLLTWWRTTLIFGGAWFAADWPLPRGLVTAARKLREQPRWEFVAGGFWRLSALCEVRGRGAMPLVPPDLNVALLLHADNVGGAFVDSSTYGHAATPVAQSAGGSVSQVASPSVWGGGAGYIHSTDLPGSYIEFPSHPILHPDNDDFTFEGWVNFPLGPFQIASSEFRARHIIFAGDCTTTAERSILVSVEPLNDTYPPQWGTLQAEVFYADNEQEVLAAEGPNLRVFLDATWYYWSFTRTAGVFDLRLNNVSQRTPAYRAKAIRNRGGKFLIGGTGAGYQSSNMYFDDFRFTNGVARDTTIPTAAFPNP